MLEVSACDMTDVVDTALPTIKYILFLCTHSDGILIHVVSIRICIALCDTAGVSTPQIISRDNEAL